MKKIILTTSIILLLIIETFGQQLQFKGQFVDSIFIKSHINAFQFDEKGTTNGRAEIFSIAFDHIKNEYVIDRFYRDEYLRTFRPDTIKIKTKIYKSEMGKKVDFSKIEPLLISLSTNNIVQNLYNQIDTVKLKNLLTEQQILKIAKWYKIDWNFKRKYSNKEENVEFFNRCKSMDSVKKYLIERFDTTGYTVVTDCRNTIDIWIKTNQVEHRFEGKYPNPIKQPWYSSIDTMQFQRAPILNLNINQTLSELLPENFLLKETISNEALVIDYIIWYFEKRKMTY